MSSSLVLTRGFHEEVLGVLQCCNLSLRILGYEGPNIDLALDGFPESSPLRRLGRQSSEVGISSVEQQLTTLLQITKIIISLTANNNLVSSIDETLQDLVEFLQEVDPMHHFLQLISRYDLYWIMKMIFSLDHPTIDIFAHKVLLQAATTGDHKLATYVLGPDCHVDLRDCIDEAFYLTVSHGCNYELAQRFLDEGANPYEDEHNCYWIWLDHMEADTTESTLSRARFMLDVWVRYYSCECWLKWQDLIRLIRSRGLIELGEMILQSFTTLVPSEFQDECRLLITAVISGDQPLASHTTLDPEIWKPRIWDYPICRDLFDFVRGVAAYNADISLWRQMGYLVAEGFDDSLLNTLETFPSHDQDKILTFLSKLLTEAKNQTLRRIRFWVMGTPLPSVRITKALLRERIRRHPTILLSHRDCCLSDPRELEDFLLDEALLELLLSHTANEDADLMLYLLRAAIRTGEQWPIKRIVQRRHEHYLTNASGLWIYEVLKTPIFLLEAFLQADGETPFWLLESDILRDNLNKVLANGLVNLDTRITKRFGHTPEVVKRMFVYGLFPSCGLLTLVACSGSSHGVENMKVVVNERASRERPFSKSDMTNCLDQIISQSAMPHFHARYPFNQVEERAEVGERIAQYLKFLVSHGAIASQAWMQLVLNRGSEMADILIWDWLRHSNDPVLSAIKYSAITTLELLFSLGFSRNQYYKTFGIWKTPVQYAAHQNNQEVVKMLLCRGADLHAPAHDKEGNTALQGAAASGNLQLVLDLLKAGADINAPAAKWEGKTALESAAEKGKLDIVDVLIANNKDLYRLRKDCKRASRLLKIWRTSMLVVIAKMLESHARRLAKELGVEHEDEIDILCDCEILRQEVEKMCKSCKAKYSETMAIG